MMRLLSLRKEIIDHNFFLFKMFDLPFDLTAVLLFDCCFEVDTKRKNSGLKLQSYRN